MLAKRVLVVEDDPAIRHIVERVLSVVLGLEALGVGDGLSALVQVAEDPPDLVITDINLPGIDGIELTRRLRETPLLSKIPIIAMTSGNRGHEALAAGCHLVIQKP